MAIDARSRALCGLGYELGLDCSLDFEVEGVFFWVHWV